MAELKPADPALHFQGTEDDPRLGQLVRPGAVVATAGARAVALLGMADDRGVVNGKGRAGAALGPTELRRYLFRLTPGARSELDGLELFDLGDATPRDAAEPIEEVHAVVEEAALSALRAGACVVLLGGGHDGAYGSHSALLRATSGVVAAVNVDAHLDVRPLREGKITSGTPFRLLGERFPDRYLVAEFGIQPQNNAREHRAWVEARGWPVLELSRLREVGPAARSLADALRAASAAEAVAVSLDLDSVEAASAPGVSAPCPDGFSAADLLGFARLAGADPRVRVLDVMELSPPLDADSRTARLGAAAIWNFLAGMAERP